MKGQLQRLGISYAWERELATCLPRLLPLEPVAVCPDVRARPGVSAGDRPSTGARAVRQCSPTNRSFDGACWRCGTTVVQKDLEQWFFRITAYADDLLAAADHLSQWPEKVLTMQRNWIGRSEGARVKFALAERRDRHRGVHDAYRPDLRCHVRAARARASAGGPDCGPAPRSRRVSSRRLARSARRIGRRA